MLIKLLVLTAVAALAPQVFPGIKVKRLATAALIAVVFGVFNLLVGWLLSLVVGLVSLPLIILSVGLFSFFVPTIVNAILLRITDALLEDFELEGWWPALGMGFLFALGGWAADKIS